MGEKITYIFDEHEKVQIKPKKYEKRHFIISKTYDSVSQILFHCQNETIECNFGELRSYLYGESSTVRLNESDKNMCVFYVNNDVIILSPGFEIHEYEVNIDALRNMITSLELIKAQTIKETSKAVEGEIGLINANEVLKNHQIIRGIARLIAKIGSKTNDYIIKLIELREERMAFNSRIIELLEDALNTYNHQLVEAKNRDYHKIFIGQLNKVLVLLKDINVRFENDIKSRKNAIEILTK